MTEGAGAGPRSGASAGDGLPGSSAGGGGPADAGLAGSRPAGANPGGGGRLGRLVRKADFDRVYAKGRRFVDRVAVLHVLSNDLELCRVGLSVSRRIGGAVERNRVKRRLREVLRRQAYQMAPGFDLVFTARGAAREARFEQLKGAVRRLLRESGVLARGGAEG